MRLTDDTVVRQLANGFLAVSEGSKPATLLRPNAESVFTCGWEVGPLIYEGDVCGVVYCEANAVGFDNGFACAAGHDHRNDVEYYDEEEMRGAVAAGHALAPNARMI